MNKIIDIKLVRESTSAASVIAAAKGQKVIFIGYSGNDADTELAIGGVELDSAHDDALNADVFAILFEQLAETNEKRAARGAVPLAYDRFSASFAGSIYRSVTFG